MREGARLAREMHQKAVEIGRLCGVDDEAAIEVMVGYCTVVCNEGGATVETAVGTLISLFPHEPIWAAKVANRLKELNFT